MSGHSKWHNIQAKKGKVDAKRGKIFTKIGKEIAMAIKQGGANLEANSKLRDVVAKAKAANMPNDNIQRALKKGAGEADSVNYESIVYEGYGPSGVAVIVETLTDNKNRSAGNVRAAFTKGGGNMGTTGCVSFMFQEKGEIIIEKGDLDEEEVMMMALEAGAEDFNADEEEVFVRFLNLLYKRGFVHVVAVLHYDILEVLHSIGYALAVYPNLLFSCCHGRSCYSQHKVTNNFCSSDKSGDKILSGSMLFSYRLTLSRCGVPPHNF